MMEYEEHITFSSGHFLSEMLPEDWHEWDQEKLYKYCEDHVVEFLEGYDGKYIMDLIDGAAHATHSYVMPEKKLLVECAEHLETVCANADEDCPSRYRTKWFNPSLEDAYEFLNKISKVLKVEEKTNDWEKTNG